MANGQTVPINIHVLENAAANGEREGTFLEPHAKVRVTAGGYVRWHVINQGYTSFKVAIAGLISPFTTGEMTITDENPRQLTNQARLYHYAVELVTGGVTYRIQDCPELEPVGP